MRHVVAVIHIAAVASVGVDCRTIAEYLTEEVDFARFQDNVVNVVHYKYFWGVAQVILDFGQADLGNKFVTGFIGIFLPIIGVEKAVVIVGKAQSAGDLFVNREIAIPVQHHALGFDVAKVRHDI